MNGWDIALIALLLAAAAASIRYLRRRKKRGGGCCGSSSGACSPGSSCSGCPYAGGCGKEGNPRIK